MKKVRGNKLVSRAKYRKTSRRCRFIKISGNASYPIQVRAYRRNKNIVFVDYLSRPTWSVSRWQPTRSDNLFQVLINRAQVNIREIGSILVALRGPG